MIDYKNDGFRNGKVMVDSTTKCTLQCSQCERKNFEYKTQNIPGDDTTIEEWDEITYYFSHVTLSGSVGDPIFNPNLIEMLKMAYQKSVDVLIHTSASHRPIEWYIEAFQAHPNAQWIFGIDGLPYQSFVYRINQDGEYLFEVMKEARKMGVNVLWQYLVFSYNEDKIQDAINLAKENDLDISIEYTGRYEEWMKPEKSVWEEKKDEGVKFIPKCLTGNKQPYLSTEGQVLPCCWLDSPTMKTKAQGLEVDKDLDWMMHEKFNIRENSFNTILNSQEYINFFDRLLKGDIPKYCKEKCTTSLKSPSRYRYKYRNGNLIEEDYQSHEAW